MKLGESNKSSSFFTPEFFRSQVVHFLKRWVAVVMKNTRTVANTVTGTMVEPAELVSAMADGELHGDELITTIRNCTGQPELLARWATYSCVAQALRTPALASGLVDANFIARFSQRFESEAPHTGVDCDIVPRPALALDRGPTLAAPAAVRRSMPASNDAQFRWKLVAGLASLCAVGVVAWSSFGVVNPNPGAAPQLASAPVSAPQIASTPAAEQGVVASPLGPMVRDARMEERMEELMAAHKQIGATSAQMPSSFLRNATFESPQRGAGR